MPKVTEHQSQGARNLAVATTELVNVALLASVLTSLCSLSISGQGWREGEGCAPATPASNGALGLWEASPKIC